MGITHGNNECKHTNLNGVEPFQGSDLIALFTSDKIRGDSNSSLSGLINDIVR